MYGGSHSIRWFIAHFPKSTAILTQRHGKICIYGNVYQQYGFVHKPNMLSGNNYIVVYRQVSHDIPLLLFFGRQIDDMSYIRFPCPAQRSADRPATSLPHWPVPSAADPTEPGKWNEVGPEWFDLDLGFHFVSEGFKNSMKHHQIKR
jgi:hypothetical protein